MAGLYNNTSVEERRGEYIDRVYSLPTYLPTYLLPDLPPQYFRLAYVQPRTPVP